MKVDWFDFVIGIVWIILGVISYIWNRDWFIVMVFLIVGIMLLFNGLSEKKIKDYLLRRNHK